MPVIGQIRNENRKHGCNLCECDLREIGKNGIRKEAELMINIQFGTPTAVLSRMCQETTSTPASWFNNLAAEKAIAIHVLT